MIIEAIGKDKHEVAGVAIVLNSEYVFLVKGAKKNLGWSFPKGKVEKGRDLRSTAIQELEEETGLKINASRLTDSSYNIVYMSKDMKFLKKLHIFTYEIENLKELQMKGMELETSRLDISEVSRGRFFSWKEAFLKIEKRQLPILVSMKKDLKKEKTNKMKKWLDFSIVNESTEVVSRESIEELFKKSKLSGIEIEEIGKMGSVNRYEIYCNWASVLSAEQLRNNSMNILDTINNIKSKFPGVGENIRFDNTKMVIQLDFPLKSVE